MPGPISIYVLTKTHTQWGFANSEKGIEDHEHHDMWSWFSMIGITDFCTITWHCSNAFSDTYHGFLSHSVVSCGCSCYIWPLPQIWWLYWYFIIPCSLIAELGNIGMGSVHQSICLPVCPSILAHYTMMAGWMFFILGTMIRYHESKIEVDSVPNVSNDGTFFIHFEYLLWYLREECGDLFIFGTVIRYHVLVMFVKRYLALCQIWVLMVTVSYILCLLWYLRKDFIRI